MKLSFYPLITVGFLLAFSAHAQPRKPIAKIPNKQQLIALTFDDGPNEVTPKILDILKRCGVHATFFEIGKNVKKHPDLSRQVLQEGHQIGNHSMTHPRLDNLSDTDAIRQEITGFQNLIQNLTGETPTVFRAPYFSMDERVWSVLDELQLPAFVRSVGGDYKADKKDLFTNPEVAQKHAQEVVQMVKKSGSGTIILMHERDITPYYLERVVQDLQAAGFHFVTLSQLLAVAP